MLEQFSPGQTRRTLLLLAAVVVLGVAAGVVGIDDNFVGISLVMLSGASLVLAFAHPWRTSAKFRRLTYASIMGFVVLFLLGIALQALVELTGMPGPVDQSLGVVGTTFLLGAAFLCIPALVVGVVGIARTRRHERDQRAAA